MKLFTLQHNCNTTRRSNSFRSTSTLLDSDTTFFKSPSTLFWVLFHCLCCLISLILGFRFSRLLFFLLFFSSSSTTITTNYIASSSLLIKATETLNLKDPSSEINRSSSSHVVVGRHGILIRPWPHPNPTEVMKAHRIIDRVQNEQRNQYGVKDHKPLIVITPTYVRTFQTLHLTGLIHSLMLVPYDLIWIVVEAGGTSNETATLLANSGIRTIHIGFEEEIPIAWEDRHRMEARMRLRALRVVREERLDGIVMFGDDSNVHSMELFDEIQSVKWIGAVSIGILAHSGNSEEPYSSLSKKHEVEEENMPMPVQGPACNSAGRLAGWHTFNSLPYVEKSAKYIDDSAIVLPRKLEWAGFVLNSRLVWKEAEDKPDWVRDLDTVAEDGDLLESPLSMLKDASFVEPLGNCGRKILMWWLRVEARADSKFPSRWIIDPPLEVTVPAKRTPWPDVPLEVSSDEKVNVMQEHKRPSTSKTGRASRSRHSSRIKRKHETRISDTRSSMSHGEER